MVDDPTEGMLGSGRGGTLPCMLLPPGTRLAHYEIAEPIGSGVLAWLWLDEVPRTGEILGGVVILLGIAVGAWPAREPASRR